MKRLTTILFLSACSLFGQKVLPTDNYGAVDLFFNISTPVIRLSEVAEGDIPELIINEAGYEDDISLRLTLKIQSKALTHYRYDVYKKDVKIFGAEAHLALDAQKKVRLCKLPFLPPYEGSNVFPGEGTDEDARLYAGAEHIKKSELVWYTDGSDYLKKGLLVEVFGPETLHEEILISSNKVISQANLHRHLHGPNDSIVSVKVFAPDPLTTAQTSYGAPYEDNNDISIPELEAERKTKSLVLVYENGEFKSKNDHVEILDFSAPNITPTTSVTDQMHYTRDLSGFEDMNVMYHITEQKNYMISLGYPNIPNYTIQVDPHAISGADQSFFSTSSTPGRLYFGEGGVDDAEDADVIIHEYMHSAIFVAAPSSTTTTERGCIEEALGDYFAASYSNTVNLHNNGDVFNWDGHNEFWPGREVSSQKDYGQESFKNNNIYLHTDLFASPLMEINSKLGRSASDAIVLEAIFYLGNNTTMPEMAGYIILSDSLLNGGANYQTIYDAFVRRNIIPKISIDELSLQSQIQVFNTLDFMNGGPIMIRSSENILSSYQITWLNGSMVQSGAIDHHSNEVFEITAPDLRSGIYLLTLITVDGQQASYKVSRID